MTSPESPPTSAEAAASILYGLPAEDFVARRDQLVKQIRADGDRGLADAIKALRKPTVVAASLNQALRGDPGLVEKLLEAVAQLRRTQEAALSGETGATDETGSFAARLADYRSAVDAVVALAPSHPVEVRAAVEAAAIGGLDDELEAAVFAVAPRPVGGFGPFVIATGREGDRGAGRAGPERGRSKTTIHPDSDRSADEATGKKPSAAQRRLAERARKAAEKTLAEAEAEHRAAEETAAEARQAVEALDERLRQLNEELEGARHARDDAIARRAAADATLSTAEDRRHQARLALEHLSADNAVE